MNKLYEKIFLGVLPALLCAALAGCGRTAQLVQEEKGTELIADVTDSVTGEAETPKTPEETVVRVPAERTKEPVCDIFDMRMSADEAVSSFVFTGEKTYDGAYISFEGALWYVDEKDAIILQDNIELYDYEPQILEYEEEKHLMLCEASFGFADTYFWGIRQQKPELLFQTPNSCFLDKGGRLAVVRTYLSNSANGRIWHRYYLYWDEEERRYREVPGYEITEEEYLSYGNAREVRDDVEAALRDEMIWMYGEDSIDRFEVTGYIKRDNGIINIRYEMDCAGGTEYRYAILEEVDGVIQAGTPSDDYSLYCEKGYIGVMGGIE